MFWLTQWQFERNYENVRPAVPSKVPNSEYPLIDNDPYGFQICYKPHFLIRLLNRHFKRVIRYMRPQDAMQGVGVAAIGPLAMLWFERVSPSYVGRGGFPPIMRLNIAIGATAGFLFAYQRSLGMEPGSLTLFCACANYH